MFCILMKKRNGNDKKKIVGPTEITKSNVEWGGGRAARGASVGQGGRGWAAPRVPSPGTPQQQGQGLGAHSTSLREE